MTDQQGSLTLEGELKVRVIKHGPIKRLFNRMRRPHTVIEPGDALRDIKKMMRG